MMKKFTLTMDEQLRAQIKATAALNGYMNMNEFIVQSIEEKIQNIEAKKAEEKNKVTV